MISRRGLICGVGALLAAPAIVRVSSIMPVRSLPAALSEADVTASIARQLIAIRDWMMGQEAVQSLIASRVSDALIYGQAPSISADEITRAIDASLDGRSEAENEPAGLRPAQYGHADRIRSGPDYPVIRYSDPVPFNKRLIMAVAHATLDRPAIDFGTAARPVRLLEALEPGA